MEPDQHIDILKKISFGKDMISKSKDSEPMEKIIKNLMIGINPINDILSRFKEKTSLLNFLITCTLHPNSQILKISQGQWF